MLGGGARGAANYSPVIYPGLSPSSIPLTSYAGRQVGTVWSEKAQNSVKITWRPAG